MVQTGVADSPPAQLGDGQGTATIPLVEKRGSAWGKSL